MGENKKYFWLKLYNDFFSSKRIKRLRSLAGGDTYTIIYLKMQLKALKDDGYLYFDGVMDEFAEELALDIDENPDDVRMTIQYLLRVGLMESSEDGKEYFLTYVPKCIGSETASTQRSRLSRARKKEQEALQCNTDATPTQQIETNCNTEIEKEIDINKEINKEIDTDTDKDKEKDIEKEHIKTVPTKKKYGEFQKVTLTDEEYTKLINEYGEDTTHRAIEFLDGYIAEKGYKSKSNYLAIRRWVIDAVSKRQSRNTTDWSQIN